MRRPVLAVALLALASAPLDAIPAFARRYRVPCMLCHDPVPRLTKFGEEFAARGFRMTDRDTVGTTSLGDPLLRLQETFPLAVRFDAYVVAQGGTTVDTDFRTPTVVKLFSGGPISDDVSYYFYLLLAEDGLTGPIEDAWVMFRRPLGIPADVTIGQFQIADPVWKRELRISLENYQILSQRVGAGAASLSYDRGIFVTASPTAGMSLTAELVNGNGIDEAVGGTWDGDSPKTGSVWLTQQLGPARLGLMAYYGNQRFLPTGAPNTRTNRTRMIGPAAAVSHGRWDVAGQFVWRDDTNPDFFTLAQTVRTRGGFAEALWWPRGRGTRLLVTGLYNHITSDDPTADYETATLNISWLYARNMRLAAEGTWDFLFDEPRVALGLVTAF